jgi:chemotaxis protein MotA
VITIDILAVSGVIVGLLAIVIGMIVKGANVAVLLNPAAAIIILIGTTAAVANSFPMAEFKRIPQLFGKVFKNDKAFEITEVLNQIVEFADLSRREGLLSLESKISNLENEFLKKGLLMVIDGADPSLVKEVLSAEIGSLEERHRSGASVFTAAGSYAPTLGVLGAVIGLIGALGNLNDTEKLGHMIAAAFVATLYGIFLGYVVCHPFATRLKRKSHEETKVMEIIVEGILSIQAGENPKLIKLKLNSFLAPSEREVEAKE